MAECDVGIHEWPCQQLAPSDVALAYAGLPTLRPARRGASPGECVFPFRQYPAALSTPAQNDGSFMAERAGGGVICAAPAARRIGRMDRRTHGRSKRFLLFAYPARVHPIRI